MIGLRRDEERRTGERRRFAADLALLRFRFRGCDVEESIVRGGKGAEGEGELLLADKPRAVATTIKV